MLSQIDSTRVKLTQHWEPNWLNIESNWLNIESLIGSTLRVKLAQQWESSWLNIESQIDPTLRVKLTQHWESNWLNIESQIDPNILQLLNLQGRIIIPPVIQLLRSKWLNFFSRCTERKNWVIWTKKFGSNFSSASDSTFQVKMTQIFLSVLWEKMGSFNLKSWVKF